MNVPAETKKLLKVLVVDDTATNRQILQVFLKKLGYDVVVAEDGEKAIERFVAENPDIILMDVMMPVMDGYEATRRIKAMVGERFVPIVFLSALDREEDLIAGLDAGGDDYLNKPVNFVILDAKLRSISRNLDLQRRFDEQRRRVAAITNNIVDGVISIDETGTMLWCNPAVESMFGYAQSDLIGQNVRMLMPEPYHSEHDGYLQRYVQGGDPHIMGLGQRRVLGRNNDGRVFPMELGVTEMRVGGRRQFVGVARDISERDTAEQTLKANAESLQRYHDEQEEESKLAFDIMQRQMLRVGLSDPSVKHWVAPTASFSGDIVASTRGSNGDLYVLLADATGHGLGAAICTLPVLSLFYSLGDSSAALSWIVTEINRQLQATMPVGRFVAASILCINQERHEAEFWLGGTPDLLLIGADGGLKKTFVPSHLALGIIDLDLAESSAEHVVVAAGDQFVLFSDGLLEAANPAGEEFGFERMKQALASSAPQTRLAAVQQALTLHMDGALPHDDVSLLIIDC